VWGGNVCELCNNWCVLSFCGDYFVVNVSSPNTAGLTSLQAKPALKAILDPLIELRAALAARSGGAGAAPKPLLVKVSSDLRGAELDDALDVAVEQGADGVVAVNTSTDPAIKGDAASIQGGISGAPLRQRALEAVGYIRRHAPEGFFVVGVGGVFDHRDAWALLRAGANVVQVYTGLVYRGPGIVKAINRGLLPLMDEAGVPNLDSLGAHHGAIAPGAQQGPHGSPAPPPPDVTPYPGGAPRASPSAAATPSPSEMQRGPGGEAVSGP